MKIKNNKKRKGFTLIELIVVIAILAILAAVAVPNFIGLTNKANTATQVAAAAEYASAINIYNTLGGTAFVQTDLTGDTNGTTVNTKLGTLTPTSDFTGTTLKTKVLDRITITAGVAKVTVKTDIA